MKHRNVDIKKEILDYIKEGHINKDRIINDLLDFLSTDELHDFSVMYNYITEDELSESANNFSDKDMKIIRDTIDKFYPEYRGQYISRFIDDVQMDNLSDDCYVDLDDAKEELSEIDIDKMIKIDEYYVGGTDNVAIVSMLNPSDGKIYCYADF